MSKSLSVLCFCFLVIYVTAATVQQWKTRIVYNLVTDRFARSDNSTTPCEDLTDYCGGTFTGIKNMLSYITGMNFNAILISPFVQNYDKGFHGEWTKDFFSINPKFGTHEELLAMITYAKSQNVYVMVDLNLNHMGNSNQNYSENSFFNDSSSYHPYCIIDKSDYQQYNQEKIQRCRVNGKADLNHQIDYVKDALLDWVVNITNVYKIEGYRIIYARESLKSLFVDITRETGVFTIADINDPNLKFLNSYFGYTSSIMNYPLNNWIRRTILEGRDMNTFKNYMDLWLNATRNTSLSTMGIFVDNNNLARFMGLGKTDLQKLILTKNAYALALTHIGIPFVYYGAEQGFIGADNSSNKQPLWTSNYNKTSQLYLFIKSVNAIRLSRYNPETATYTEIYRDNEFYAFNWGGIYTYITNQPGKNTTRYISQNYYNLINGNPIVR